MTHEEITEYIFIENQEQSGDIALVFGTWNARQAAVDKATELYKKKLIPKIIVSGGLNRNSKQNEAEWMLAKLLKQGIPANDILVEDKAGNTLENVLLSRDIIDKELGLENIRVITAIMNSYHARRSLMTLRKHIPAHIVLKAAPYTSSAYDFTRDTWSQSQQGTRLVESELTKIKSYLAKGDITEV